MKKSNGFLINEESRQHINLSIKANSVIESDMVRFNDDYDLSNKSGFLNKILSNYYNSFPLSMVVALKQLNVIRKAIKSDAVSDRITSKIIDEFSYETMKNSISEYAKRYKYDIQLKLKLNKENASKNTHRDQVLVSISKAFLSHTSHYHARKGKKFISRI
jgi:hypothetical protein